MATTVKQDNEFNSAMEGQFEIKIAGSALETAIGWIADNMKPGDVFSDSDLTDWARDKKPDDVFDRFDLEEWAEANGYIKE